jgi:hypothetical protein
MNNLCTCVCVFVLASILWQRIFFHLILIYSQIENKMCQWQILSYHFYFIDENVISIGSEKC